MRRSLRMLLLGLVVGVASFACMKPAGDAAAAGRVPVPGTHAFTAQTALYEVFVRDFSPEGTLQGVIRGLDRIQATGAEVVWLMPIYPVGVKNHKGKLGSPYAVKDYHAINPAFGTAADLHELVDSVHARGMKIILGWVPNHTAWDNVWVTEHPDYYAHTADGKMTVPRDLSGHLTDWTDVAELDYDNPALRRAMIDAMKYWLTTFDVDGFRMDVAGFIPDSFWKEAIPQLRAVRPILLLAEWDDPKMQADGFDLTYPWSSYSRLKAVWKGGPAADFVEKELQDLAQYPDSGGMRMRMTTNHDETAWDAPPVTLFGGPAGARAAYVAMALLPGPPLLYNGQAVESPQKLGLFDKEPVDWNQPDADEARAFYRKVIGLSRTNPSLVNGGLAVVATDAEQDVIAYRRGDVVVLVNARSKPVNATVTAPDLNGARNLLGGGVQHGQTVALPAYGAVVLALAG
jgi:glycosidase